MISFDEARNTILATIQPLEATRVLLRDALGRIAAETIVADADAVPFPRSAMDGYAVRAAECSRATREHPIDLPRSEERRVGKEGRSRWSPDH